MSFFCLFSDNCTAGYHFDTGAGECRACLKGYYQDERGQLRCKSCPVGTTTENEGANSVELCASELVFNIYYYPYHQSAVCKEIRIMK